MTEKLRIETSLGRLTEIIRAYGAESSSLSFLRVEKLNEYTQGLVLGSDNIEITVAFRVEDRSVQDSPLYRRLLREKEVQEARTTPVALTQFTKDVLDAAEKLARAYGLEDAGDISDRIDLLQAHLLCT